MAQVPKVRKVIEIPQEVNISLEGDEVKVGGPKGELKKSLHYPGVRIRQEDSSIVIEAHFPSKRQLAVLGTFEAHIRNMIKGVSEGFTYKLKAVYSHFPINVKTRGDEVLIENFLGERVPRRMKVFGDCSVRVKGQEVTVEGIDKEEVGQTAARMERLTRVAHSDRKVFQDGIYLVERDGEKL